MPRYISQHTLACLTRQGAEEISRRLLGGQPLAARRVVFNMQEGKMIAEFDAPGREELEKWLAAGKFHFDWLLRIELEAAADGSLQPCHKRLIALRFWGRQVYPAEDDLPPEAGARLLSPVSRTGVLWHGQARSSRKLFLAQDSLNPPPETTWLVGFLLQGRLN